MIIKVDPDISIVFDLDDTLYKEVNFLRSAFIAIAKSLEINNWEFLFTHMFALHREKNDVFDFLSKEYGLTKSNLITDYRNHIPDIEPLTGVKKLMEDIKDKNGRIGILTDGRRLTQMNKINALGIQHLLDAIVISEDIGSEKPDKKNFSQIENTLKTKRYYYIADNFKKDFITPNAMQWNTIGLMDNGLNIHNNAHNYNDERYLPKKLVQCFTDICVL